jgi:hypothetical protein
MDRLFSFGLAIVLLSAIAGTFRTVLAAGILIGKERRDRVARSRAHRLDSEVAGRW